MGGIEVIPGGLTARLAAMRRVTENIATGNFVSPEYLEGCNDTIDLVLKEVLILIEEEKRKSGSEDRGVGDWFIPDADELMARVEKLGQ